VTHEHAEVVELGEGERKTGFMMVVTPLPEAAIAGIVLFEGGPVADADVSAAATDGRGMSMKPTKTDSNGKFMLRVLAGTTYRIRAGVREGVRYRHVEKVVAADEQKDEISLSIPR
jgi:hypothetical protein